MRAACIIPRMNKPVESPLQEGGGLIWLVGFMGTQSVMYYLLTVEGDVDVCTTHGWVQQSELCKDVRYAFYSHLHHLGRREEGGSCHHVLNMTTSGFKVHCGTRLVRRPMTLPKATIDVCDVVYI